MLQTVGEGGGGGGIIIIKSQIEQTLINCENFPKIIVKINMLFQNVKAA